MTRKDKKNNTLKKLAALVAARRPGEPGVQLQAFADALYEHAAPEDLIGRRPDDVYGAVASHWDLLAQRDAGQPKVRIYSPIPEQHDWQSTHSVVEIVTDDMPFLVDSVRMALNRYELTVHLVVHCVANVRRDASGRMIEFAARSGGVAEAIVYIEIDRRTEAGVLERLHADLLEVFIDVRAAVVDWPKMRAKVWEIMAELAASPPPIDAQEFAEAKAFLEWIEDHHFTFLGYRQYDLVQEDGEDVLRMVPGSALGTAPRVTIRSPSQTFVALPPERRVAFREPCLLVLTKANVRATVHRPVYMDYVGIKRFDGNGAVIGEHRFLGLYTSAAYNRNLRDIPLLRRKLKAVFERSGLAAYSHNGKALLNILETYPRDELFQIGEAELLENALSILHLQERPQVLLLVREETFGRFVTCLVYVPRERFDTEVRERIQTILMEAFNGESVDFTVHLSESVLARVYFTIRTPLGGITDVDVAALETRIAASTRTWTDQLHDALVESLGEEAGSVLFQRYRHAFPAAYRDDFDARAAVRDIEDIEELAANPSGQVTALYCPLNAPPGEFRFKLFASGQAFALSDTLPVLENMGVRVIRERPYEIHPGGETVWVYDFALAHGGDGELVVNEVKETFQETFASVWQGRVENDGFNRLVLRARLACREVVILRAYGKYLRQTGVSFSQTYMEQVLADHAAVARQLIGLFHARFDVERHAHAAVQRSRLLAEIQEALDAVVSLDADRILRGFLAVIQATVRTSFYQSDGDGRLKDYVAFKLDPGQLPDLPLPRPKHEIWVYSPRVEGVHLRGGDVARGGLRWSDRREDFRTEVLGLMKAQMVKNAIIVPVGAKGGFVVKRPAAGGDRALLMEEVIACYRMFVRGLLDLTDNIVEGRVTPPPGLIRYDGDDPYLVVAADKGTATFSDIANAVAAEYGFWLGDAFASGGANGYDHKKMGITARGAWESVKRHFRELGMDTQTTPFTVVGVGDMSGDVFGNGVLQSRQIKLIGAFDHRHVFLDPDPDPEATWRERQRLFGLARSSWADYDPALISKGGGVYPRSAKTIRLSPQARQALGTPAESLTPDDLIRALLRAPVDLLWNGGIGTYVKSSHETNLEVGDRSNDAVRVNGRELRCRVVGEGGNLGFTQRGRIEYALNGGCINTDFIDNAGGVTCSDYEVNIKILLNAAVADGVLTRDERDRVLADMTDEVAALVLQETYWQTWAISIMRQQAGVLVDEHQRFMRALEREGRLDRALEHLPDDEALGERRLAGEGLTRPEQAVLITYAKNTLNRELLASDAPEDPYLARELVRYFPVPLRERFQAQTQAHRLRRELIATFVTNRLVNRLGATFVFRMQEEQGASVAQIVRAYLAMWEIFELREIVTAIAELDNQVAAEVQTRMLLEAVRVVQRGTLWLLRSHAGAIDISTTVARYKRGAQDLAERLPVIASPEQAQRLTAGVEPLAAAGVPDPLAARVARLPSLYAVLDIVDIADETANDVERAAAVYFALDARLEVNWLRERIYELPAEDRWRTRARAALDDDLYAQQRRVAAEVLRVGDGRHGPDALLEAWFGHTGGGVDRYLRLLTDIKSVSAPDMAMLSVAMREFSALARMAAPDRPT